MMSLYLSKMSQRDMQAEDCDHSTVAKDVRYCYHLYQPEQMHQDCVLLPYQGDCDVYLYFLHYPNLREVDIPESVYADTTDGDMTVYVDYSGNDDGGDSSGCNGSHNSMDNPNHNTNLSSICMANSSSSTESPIHNTNYMKVQPLHPTNQTSKSHTLAQPTPYRQQP